VESGLLDNVMRDCELPLSLNTSSLLAVLTPYTRESRIHALRTGIRDRVVSSELLLAVMKDS
jgi:hypothetical protein